MDGIYTHIRVCIDKQCPKKEYCLRYIAYTMFSMYGKRGEGVFQLPKCTAFNAFLPITFEDILGLNKEVLQRIKAQGDR